MYAKPILTEKALTLSSEQINLIKSQIAQGATDDELKFFLYQCERTGLDPLTRQIYFIKRGGRMTVQTSIDGFRVIAERSKMYAGQDEPVFKYDQSGEILSCTTTVYKWGPNGQRYPAGVGVAFYKEYYPNPMGLQKTLKHTMISKVSEALALRKAFPVDLSGLYTTEEMAQAGQQKEDIEEYREFLIGQLMDLEMEEGLKEKAFEALKAAESSTKLNQIKTRLEKYQNQ
jgi:phage recombination protein Bet